MKIAIVDYGMGNIHSLKSSLSYITPGADIELTHDRETLSNSDVIFLPGVGHFQSAMSALDSLGLVEILKSEVVDQNKPIMGICLGMQLLFKSSEEGSMNKGLGLLDAKVRKIEKGENKIPHIGFNTVVPPKESKMFKNIEQLDFYFVHSYCVRNEGLMESEITYCDYNERFVAAVESKNIWGTQFHPEKSQFNGLRLLKNFIDQHGN